MGDPKKLRKKYKSPSHPWNATAIAEQKVLKYEYGLVIKREIYLAESFVKKYRGIAKRLSIDESSQAQHEKAQMLEKLQNLGLLSAGADLKDVLGLGEKDILARRLQTLVFKKGLAKTIKQARQFITHRHIKVGEKEITAPSYLVTLSEESQILFKENSALSDMQHPERVDPNQDIKKEVEVVKNAKAPSTKDETKGTKLPEELEVEKGLKEEIAKEEVTKDKVEVKEKVTVVKDQTVEVKPVGEVQ